MAQLDKCLKFKAFQGVILCRVRSLLSSRNDLNFRHLSSSGTISVGHCVEMVNILAICLLKTILLLILYFSYMRIQKKLVSILSLSKI